MSNFKGIAGYVFLIIGAIFIDTPYFSIFLGIPMFIVGVILLMLFYDKILMNNNKLGLLGMVIICVILAFSAIEFNQYLVLVNKDEYEGLKIVGWIKIGGIFLLNILASYFVYLGFGKQKIKNNSLIVWWLPTLYLIPLVIFLIQILYWKDYWVGGQNYGFINLC